MSQFWRSETCPFNDHSRISKLKSVVLLRTLFIQAARCTVPLLFPNKILKNLVVSAGVQASYWNMLEEGRITRTAALILMQSVDEALDKVSRSNTKRNAA